jgi:hypothetical protein
MRTLFTLLFFGISTFTSLFANVDCSRYFDGPLPFIGEFQDSFHLTPKYQNENWIGVECRHGNEKSPHLIGTHVESSRHVFGDHKTLKQVIEANPAYLNEMRGVHVRVSPTQELVVQVIDLGDDRKMILYENGDTYALAGSFSTQSLEHIISLQTIESAFAHSIISNETILFYRSKMVKK